MSKDFTQIFEKNYNLTKNTFWEWYEPDFASGKENMSKTRI